jgi:hypothetical protein
MTHGPEWLAFLCAILIASQRVRTQSSAYSKVLVSGVLTVATLAFLRAETIQGLMSFQGTCHFGDPSSLRRTACAIAEFADRQWPIFLRFGCFFLLSQIFLFGLTYVSTVFALSARDQTRWSAKPGQPDA